MDNFLKFTNSLTELLKGNLVVTIMSTILIAFIIYYSLRIVWKNNAEWLVLVFVVVEFVCAVIFILLGEDKPYGWTFVFLPIVYLAFVISLFATEIKREIWDMSSNASGEVKQVKKNVNKKVVDQCVDEIIRALQNMSKNDVGALIILSGGTLPKAILDSGVSINAKISSALIESIFFPKTPLHDGAMIINGTQIQSAGCFLPLSQEINLPKELGTRHRAGIGITETINVTAIIVSEETGVISIAQGGKIKRYADTEMLRKTLGAYYWQDLIS